VSSLRCGVPDAPAWVFPKKTKKKKWGANGSSLQCPYGGCKTRVGNHGVFVDK
jgi:hypothetical protein